MKNLDWLLVILLAMTLGGCSYAGYSEERVSEFHFHVEQGSFLEVDVQGVDVATARETSQKPYTDADIDAALALQGATATAAKEAVLKEITSSFLQKWKDSFNPKTETTTTPPPVVVPVPKPEPGEDDDGDDSPGDSDDSDGGNSDDGDNSDEGTTPPPTSGCTPQKGYKYCDVIEYKGPIQIAPEGQQGNSTYYYFLYRLPKGQHGCQTYGDNFRIVYPDGKTKTFSPSGSKCGSDYGIPGYWYRPGDSSGHKEVFSMEVYWGKDGQWKSTSKVDREKTRVQIHSNKERK